MVKKGEFFGSLVSLIIFILATIMGLIGFETQTTQTQENITIQEIELNKIENVNQDILLQFCPKENCHKTYYDTIKNAKFEIKCALHEFDDTNLSTLLAEKANEKIKTEIIIDGRYINEEGLKPILNSKVKLTTDGKRSKLMHNKFCIIDNEILITGSTNPTENGFYKNNNNQLKINSKLLAKNYENEFDQMNSDKFQKQKKSVLKYNNITLNYQNEQYKISTYFCPEDNCAEETLKIIQTAKKEILFANFVLTLDNLEDLLIEKSQNNVNVQGIIENRMKNIRGSKIQELNQSFPITIDKNKNTMHHKFFVIDEKYVITGSMNPSAGGTNGNDENLIIIENPKIAKQFKEEFNRLNTMWTN